MKDLNQFVKDNQKFFKIGDGETWVGTYLGYNIGIDRFNPDKEVANYKLRADGSERNIFWGTGRMDVAITFSKMKPGTMISITRSGSDKTNTSYKIFPIEGGVKSFDPDAGDAQE